MIDNAYLIYHNPQCSKSRGALQLLRERGIEPQIIDYQKAPPDIETLKQLVSLLQIPVAELVRRQESLLKDIVNNPENLSDEEWLEVLSENPKLLQRPIVVCGEKALIARPPEMVLELIPK